MFGNARVVPEFVGSVHFRGGFPLRASDFHFLRDAGLELVDEVVPQDGPLRWSMQLRHPQWGEAHLSAWRDPSPIPRILIEHTSPLTLTLDEKEEALLAGTSVELTMPLPGDDPLRERKRALRFLHAVMGEHGTLATDQLAQQFWSRAALDDELAHDAALDIAALFTVHAVGDEGRATWLHTHGLGALGSWDFDVLAPAPDVAGRAASSLFRALAWAVIEKGDEALKDPLHVFTDGVPVCLVPASEFDRRADQRFVSLRDPEDHVERRGIVCDPVQRRLFRTPAPHPARRLMETIPPTVGLCFSNAATDQIAERARQTLPMLQKLTDELADFDCQPVVKLGIPVDGATQGEREHMWFEVHAFSDESLDATLLNEPWNVSSMRMGDRGWHPVSLITDWSIATPLGSVTPGATAAARYLRDHREEVLAALRAQG